MNKGDTKEIPTINLKMETKELKSGLIYVPYVMFETPYMIFSNKDGTQKIWTKDKKKIILWYLYKITKIKWFIKNKPI
jgi:hypothetical protein